MRLFTRVMAGASVGALALLAGPVAAAHADTSRTDYNHNEHDSRRSSAVFVQSNAPTGNQVLVYARKDDGSLRAEGSYATGGNGGAEVGAVVDPLASQDSLTYDARR
jgi:hypothetical protein